MVRHQSCQPKAGRPRAEKPTITFYVYILKCVDNTLYKGSTTDLKNRVLKHNKGKVKSTKWRLPVKLIYYEAFLSKTDCGREELFLKSGKGKERIKLLLKITLEK